MKNVCSQKMRATDNKQKLSINRLQFIRVAKIHLPEQISAFISLWSQIVEVYLLEARKKNNDKKKRVPMSRNFVNFVAIISERIVI